MSSKKHAILAATSEFPNAGDRLPSLPAAAENVDLLYKALCGSELGGFADVEAAVDLPHWDVMSRVDQVLRSAKRDDLVLLYYAGYALVHRSGRMFLATINTDANREDETSLPTGSMRSLFSETECRRLVVIFDCVYSFEGEPIPVHQIEGLDVSISGPTGYTTCVMTTSSRISEVDEWGTEAGSFMTAAMLEAIHTGRGDLNHDGVITLEELFDYTRESLREQGRVEPHLFKTGTTGSLVIARSPTLHEHERLVSRILGRMEQEREQPAIFERVKEILDLPEEAIAKDHEAVFALLRDWERDRISLKELTDQWYQFDDTRLVRVGRSSEVQELEAHWSMIQQCRLPVLDLIGPSYLLDKNFHFLDWNPMFDELVAKPMGLTRFRHAEDFVLKLKNSREVIERSQRDFAEGEFPMVHIEDLEFESPEYGLIRFKKIASQIPAERGGLLAWSVQLNITSAEKADEMWADLHARLSTEVNWSIYARLYDDMLLNFDPYRALVNRMVELLGDAESVADLGAGTGNGTAELVRRQPDREVWAFESNEEMLNQLRAKIRAEAQQARVKCFKGDMMLSLRECPEERFDGALLLNVLYAISERARCLREIFRVLKPGGVLVYSTSSSQTDVEHLFDTIRANLDAKGALEGLRSTVDHAYDRHCQMRDDIMRDSPEDLVAYAVRAGFDVDQVWHGEYEGAVSIVRAVKPEFVVIDGGTGRSDGEKYVADDRKEPPCVFICYAREDSEWCNRLKRQLHPAKQNRRVDVWADTEIHAGSEWEPQISKALDRSTLAVLLVTPHFLSSEYIHDRELPRIFDREIDVIPVLIEPSMIEEARIQYPDPANGPKETVLSKLQFETYDNDAISLVDRAKQNVFINRLAQKIVGRAVPARS